MEQSPCRAEILYLLISKTLFSFPLVTGNYYSILYFHELVLTPHIRGFLQYLSVYVAYFSWHNIFQIVPCFSYGSGISFFLMWSNNPVIIYTAFIYMFISNEALRLFPYFEYCGYCWSELKMLISLSDLDLSFLGELCCKCGMVDIYDSLIFE